MAFDQNLIPNDLRPLNIVRTVADEVHIMPVTASGRPIEGFYANPPRDGSPGSVPGVYYPVTVPDTGFVGLGFSNAGAAAGVAGWVPRVAPLVPPQPGVMSAGLVNSGSGFSHVPSFGARSRASDQASDEGGDGSAGVRKVKFLCSFGGKILPRPSDGALRYVGGQTRIITVRRDVSFNELVHKMVDIYGENVVIKYQLPDEDLDALVSVSCLDDLENMMDEYEKLVERSSDGSAKLKVFLFSALEVESAGGVQISDLRDSGMKYFEAINGILDGVGTGHITRKESTASAASTQNSEVSGADAGDSLGHAQVEVNGPPSAGVPSPRENSTPSQQATPRMPFVDPNIHVDASTAPLGLPMVISGSSPTIPVQREHEVETSVPVVVPQQIGLDTQQPGVTFPASSAYMQVYVDPQREIPNRGDFVRHPSQMGFPAQILGTVAPVSLQQHVSAGVTPQQFIPSVQMTMPSPSHVSMNPNMVPALIHPQQIRLEQFPAESMMAQRVVQLPVNSMYGPYQGQVPPAVIGGPYAWHQVPQQEQVTCPEGWVPKQQALAPERISRFEDCSMCQKGLPHAHSDTIAQDQKESPASTFSDPKMVHHSLQLDDKGLPANRTVVYGVQGEGTVEQQGTDGAQLRGHVEPTTGKTQVETIGVPQKEGHYGGDSFVLQKGENLEQPKVSVPQSVLGLTGGIHSPFGVLVGTVPQSYQDSVVPQVVVPTQYQIRQEPVMVRPANGDPPTVGGMPLQTSGYQFHESPKDYPGISPVVPKEDIQESYALTDHLGQIDGRMENLRITPGEVVSSNGQSKSPNENLKREDIFENRPTKVGEREAHLDANFGNPHLAHDANLAKQNEMLPLFANESPYLHNLRPVESYEVAQPPLFGNPSLYPHPTQGVNRMDHDEIHSAVPAFSVVNTAHPLGECQDNIPASQLKNVPSDIGGVLLDGNPASSQSPSYGVRDMQDNPNSLFSDQDPWNFQQDTHFPPKPKQIQLKKEPLCPRDPSGDRRTTSGGELPVVSIGGAFMTEAQQLEGVHQTSGNVNADLNFVHSQSDKGSAEDLIKRELQAVAEGVAASVLHTSDHSNPDIFAHGKSETSTMTQENNEVQKTDVEVENKDKFEEIKAKLPEKINCGFPLSDGIGRLQIIKNSDLEELRELGSGTFGTVYHGKWRGTDVAIKRINERCFAGKPSEQERMIDDFWNEAIKLADLHHPNVVAFYGVVLDGPGGSVATVTEYMVNGSLRTALQKNERSLDKRKRLVIAMDVAFGMEYLHGKKIVHFDLKSDNLLVNLRDPQRPICKVGDLGLSKVKCQTLISGGVRGTLPWMAPELLNGSSSLVSEKVDVYSFGIVMWELLTGEEPYADLHYGAIIGGIVSNTLRPPIPDSCDSRWRSLMERCWSSEPPERPSFTEIANELRVMTSKTLTKGQMQQSHTSAHPHTKS